MYFLIELKNNVTSLSYMYEYVSHVKFCRLPRMSAQYFKCMYVCLQISRKPKAEEEDFLL